MFPHRPRGRAVAVQARHAGRRHPAVSTNAAWRLHGRAEGAIVTRRMPGAEDLEGRVSGATSQAVRRCGTIRCHAMTLHHGTSWHGGTMRSTVCIDDDLMTALRVRARNELLAVSRR